MARRRFLSAVIQHRFIPIARILTDVQRTIVRDPDGQDNIHVTLPKNWHLETAGTAFSVNFVAGSTRNVWNIKPLVHNIGGQWLVFKNPGNVVVMQLLVSVN